MFNRILAKLKKEPDHGPFMVFRQSNGYPNLNDILCQRLHQHRRTRTSTWVAEEIIKKRTEYMLNKE